MTSFLVEKVQSWRSQSKGSAAFTKVMITQDNYGLHSLLRDLYLEVVR